MIRVTAAENHLVLFVGRPAGNPEPENFREDFQPIPTPGKGEVLLRTLYLSLDPYMRGRMTEQPSYAANVALGDVMVGATVAEIMESNLEEWKPGERVLASGGWQAYSISDGSDLTRIHDDMPVTAALGLFGMPSKAAYFGLLDVGRPKKGETVLVSAASGAVGSIAAQIARIKGCRVVGIAGGERKCAYLVERLGLDAGIDRRAPDFAERLSAACPDGVDIYFDNVGGDVLHAALALCNVHGRVVVCGSIGEAATQPPASADRGATLMRTILVKRLRVEGFIVRDYAEREAEFTRDMAVWFKEGRLYYREDIVDGLENAPRAFTGLFKGENFGKLLVRVAPEA